MQPPNVYQPTETKRLKNLDVEGPFFLSLHQIAGRDPKSWTMPHHIVFQTMDKYNWRNCINLKTNLQPNKQKIRISDAIRGVIGQRQPLQKVVTIEGFCLFEISLFEGRGKKLCSQMMARMPPDSA